MKFSWFYLFLVVLISSSLVGAESIGEDFKVNQSMQITNYCSLGNCNYVNLISIKYPNDTIIQLNASMTGYDQSFNYTFIPDQIGEYSFVSCGVSTLYVCDEDTFKVTYNGESFFVGVHIILLIFFILMFFGFYHIQQRINFDKWYNRLISKYEHKNYFNAVGGTIGYFFLKNLFAIYYFLGLFIVLVLTDIVFSYNVVSLIRFVSWISYFYTLCSIGVILAIFGQAQQFILGIVDELKNLSWGIVNGKE